jgi:ABC-type transport system involved in cytochrome bd biosynthesis fused ATPase/permease subunit
VTGTLDFANRYVAHRKEEKKQKEAHDLAAAEELQRTRSEDARKRALEREARRFAKAQTSASAAASASRLSLHNQSSTAGNSGLSMTRSSTSASHTGTGAASAVFTPNLSHSTTMTTLDTASPSAPVTPKINNVPGPGFAKQPSATDAGANSE